LFGLTNIAVSFTLLDMRSFWRTLDRDIALVCLADAIVGVSFGAIAVSGGLRPWVPVALSVFVFAGGAQFAAVGVILSGGSPVAAVVAGLVLNARHLPYGFAVAEVFGARNWTRLIGAHLLIDEAVAFTLRHADPQRRRQAYWTCGIALFMVWNLAVVAGALAGTGIGDTSAYGLDAAFPTVILALVLPSLRERGTRDAALAGAVIAVAATPFLPPGLPVLLALLGLLPAVRSRTEARKAH
jgi:4-azaleucine resistance transporter AzlC